MEWKDISKKWIELSNRMWTKRSRELVDELFVEYTNIRIKLENLTKHNSSFIQDCSRTDCHYNKKNKCEFKPPLENCDAYSSPK